MADHHQRQARVLRPGKLDDQVQIGGQVLALRDQRPLAVRAPVAEVVEAVNRRPIGQQPLDHMGIAADVLGVAVDDDRDVTGVGVRPGGGVERALAALEFELPRVLHARGSLADGGGR